MIKLQQYHQKPSMCGPASLKMVADYYGVLASEDELAKIAGSTLEKGTTVKGIIRAAKKIGFNVFVKEDGTIDDLKYFVDNGIPVIVRWFSFYWGH